jgi:hypothetical protein
MKTMARLSNGLRIFLRNDGTVFGQFPDYGLNQIRRL